MLIPPYVKYIVKGLYTKETPEGAEVETSELLYSLVRHSKPLYCVETGTAWGQTSSYIGRALRDNGQGILHTCDIEHRPEIDPRIADLPVVFHQQRGIDLINETDTPIDFCFIDSWWVDVRIEEMRAVVPKIAPGGLLCLHDPSQNYKWVYDKTVETVNWPNIVFHAPYGLAVFRKPSDEDWSGVGKEIQLEPIV